LLFVFLIVDAITSNFLSVLSALLSILLDSSIETLSNFLSDLYT